MTTIQNTLRLGMPHLNSQGLDEVWLLKFLGDIHWKILDQKLGLSGERQFYASFFDIKIEFEHDQSSFKEFQTFQVDSSLTQLNSKIYKSYHKFHGCTASLTSIFITVDQQGKVQKYQTPAHGTDHRDLRDLIDEFRTKKKNTKYIDTECKDIVFPVKMLFNNANILYFANYLFLIGQSEMIFNVQADRPVKSLKISYFKNMLQSDSVRSYSELSGVYRTKTCLFVNSEPMCHCEIVR